MAGVQRYLDHQGRPTVEVTGLPKAPVSELFHHVLSMRWRYFLLLAFCAYLTLNALFATLYWLDAGGVENVRPGSFLDAYFFSVESMMTIGYGRMVPISAFAHLLVTIEAFVGMLVTALTTGMVFAKFAVPTANVLFSKVVCISKHEGVPTLRFRLANARGNRLVQAGLSVTLAKATKTLEGESFRRVFDVKLVRDSNPLFWIGWTALHPIDEESPFYGETKESLLEKDAELVVVVLGVDEHSSATVHARCSYGPEDMRWGERFVDLLSSPVKPGVNRSLDFSRFHDTQPAEL